MNFWQSVGGMIVVEVTGADVPRTLCMIQDENIPIYNTVRTDELTVHFEIRRTDYKKMERIINRRGDALKLVRNNGVYWTARRLMRRCTLLTGLLLLFVLSILLPTRIYFIRVEGNEKIPSRQVLEQASQCGISFGASRRTVRSEKMKNALLEAMPQLKWAGINTSGCTAVISVRERELNESLQEATGISSIIADRDGIILSCTVTKGNQLCKVGQAVKAGQVLVSGYTDCGLTIRASSAEGEIFARTERDLEVISDAFHKKRTKIIRTEKKYSVRIGKKQINFYKDSGISDVTCDKMYVENELTVPGGFVLPVLLVTEVRTYYDSVDAAIGEDELALQLSAFAEDYLDQQMIAGKILSSNETLSSEEGFFSLKGQYACREMICRVQKEGVITPNGKHD